MPTSIILPKSLIGIECACGNIPTQGILQSSNCPRHNTKTSKFIDIKCLKCKSSNPVDKLNLSHMETRCDKCIRDIAQPDLDVLTNRRRQLIDVRDQLYREIVGVLTSNDDLERMPVSAQCRCGHTRFVHRVTGEQYYSELRQHGIYIKGDPHTRDNDILDVIEQLDVTKDIRKIDEEIKAVRLQYGL